VIKHTSPDCTKRQCWKQCSPYS